MKQHKFLLKIGLIAAVVPMLAYAYHYGPDPRRTGAPGDGGTCLGSGCHSGTLNTGGGSLKITDGNGAALTAYTPGVTQRIKVQITDAAKAKFGFEFTARLASNLSNGQAGDFITVDALTQTLCDNGSPKNNGGSCEKFPVQFIEHTLAGYSASTGGGYTYQFDWTPPSAASAGNVTLYAASVAGPGGAPTSANVNVYTTNITLAPAAAPSGPSINPGGIVNSVTGNSPVSQGSLVAIYGAQLASSLVINSSVPLSTSLGNTSVTIDGLVAPLTFVSPGQVNVQVPWEALGGGTGTANVIVTSSGVKSATQTVTLGAASPGVYATADGHAIAINVQDPASARYVTISAPSGSIPGLTTFPAKVGDVLVVYATGLGKLDSTPATGADSGGKTRTAVTTPVVLIGGQPAKVLFAGLSSFVGVYQINLIVPQVTAGSAVPMQIQLGGVTSPATTNIAVQ